MNKRFLIICCLLCVALWAVAAQQITSPNGLIAIQPKGEGYVIFEDYNTALGGAILINHVGDCFD